MKRRSVRMLLFTLVSLLLIVGVLSLLTYRQMRQDRLNQALIAALKAEDYPAALQVLQQRADARTRDYPPDTRSFWPRLLDRLHGNPSKASANAPTALDLLIEGPIDNISPGVTAKLSSLPDWEATLKALLKGGADPKATATGHRKRINCNLLACYPLEALRTFLAYGFRMDVHAPEAQQWLVCCVDNPNPGVTEFLLDRGMSPNALGAGDTLVLTFAVRRGNQEAVKVLLDHGASVRAKAEDGNTALDEAVEPRMSAPELIPILKGMPPMKFGVNDHDRDAIIALLKAHGATSRSDH